MSEIEDEILKDIRIFNGIGISIIVFVVIFMGYNFYRAAQ